MENLLTRYRNSSILVAVLFAQVLGLAVQVRRTTDNESSRLIRVWAVNLITPFEKGIVWLQSGTGNLWHDYVYLRGVRQENRDLKMEIERLKLQQVRLSEDAEQARRLQSLLSFKEEFIAKTVAAQVIGSSGSVQSRSVYIDKGSNDGIKPDMAVITAGGIVGKVLRVYGSTSQILLINDQSSGVGAILEKTRLQGVLRGTVTGQVVLDKILADETVEQGEVLRTSGGDQVFPKGMPVGTVTKVARTPEAFLNIQIKPAADLGKLEEVLVITQKQERLPDMAENGATRAADILSRRLPSVPDKPVEAQPQAGGASTENAPAQPPVTAVKPKPQANQTGTAGTPNTATLKTTAPAQKPAQSVVKVSDDLTKQSPAEPKAEPPQPSTEEDKPR